MQEPTEAARRYQKSDTPSSPEADALIAESEKFESLLSEALDVGEVGDPQRWVAGIDAEESSSRRPLWMTAMAALLVGAVGIGLTLTPTDSRAQRLQTAMLEHVAHESDELEWAKENGSMATADLSGGAIGPQEHPVVYLNKCIVDGQVAVHGIVETPAGPVTAIYVPEREIRRDMKVSGDEVSGRMLADANGVIGFFSASVASINTLSDQDADDFAAAAKGLLNA